MAHWGKEKGRLFWLGLGCIWSIILIHGCIPQPEVVDLKPHVNKVVLQVNELANQVYDMDSRLKSLERRENQIPDYVKRLADLETKFNSLKEEVHSHFIAGQEDNSLWKNIDQKLQDLNKELEIERKRALYFQEETKKNLKDLSDKLMVSATNSEELKISEAQPVPPAASPVTSAPPTSSASPPTSRIIDEKSAYEEAYAIFQRGDWPEARNKFQAFLLLYPKSKLADNAQFWIGESFYHQKEYERAILEYEKVIQNYPQGEKLPSALMKQALAFYAIGRIKEARILFQQVIKKAPHSEQAQIAGKKLEAIAKEEGR